MSIDAIATTSAEERQLAVEFAAAVLEEAAPDEVAALDDLSAEFFADPQRALQRDDRDEEFAFGVGLGVRSEVATLVLAAVVAAVGASAVVVARDVLVPVGDATTPEADPEFAELDYRARIGPAFFSASHRLWQTALEIENGTATSSARAERYRAEVIPAARDLLDRARAFSSGSPEVDDVHARCVAALELAATGYEELAAGYEGERVDLLEQGTAHLEQHIDEWLAWGEAVDGLG
jgi:hypothetical protein